MRKNAAQRRAPKPGVFRLTALAACLMSPWLAWGQMGQNSTRFDTFSDFGGIGLLQTPTARFAAEGDIAVSVSYVEPYLRTSVNIQPLPWLEGTVRYTDIGNRLYGPQNFSGDQTFKDKGVDFKVRLWEESKHVPQVALGFRDFGGTGLFSSEYLVMSRRYFDLDFSLGLGWGYLGRRGQFKNPFATLSDRFLYRPLPTAAVVQAGNLSSAKPFSGERVSLFGGVIYKTPVPGLILKLEYDANDYKDEPLNNPQKVRSPFNIGAVYSYSDWLDISAGFERGDKFMVQFALRSNIHSLRGMPKLDPEPEALRPRDLRNEIAAFNQQQKTKHAEQAIQRMSESLAGLDYQIDSIEYRGKEMIAHLSQSTFRSRAKAIGRAARAMANAAPADIELLTVVDLQGSLETQRVSFLRKDLEAASRYQASPEEISNNLTVSPPRPQSAAAATSNPNLYPNLSWGWAPAMRHHIGGPDNPYFFQVFLRGFADFQLTRNFSLSGEVGVDVFNNFDGLKLNSNSLLPHVRSDIKNYLKEGKTGITHLQADYIRNFGSETFGRASAGLYEDMFGGVGGEILYKPFGKRWAIGADLYRVRQRDYDKRFAFRDYEVTTGHIDLYYQLPFYNILAQVSLGQYLAGDRGATLTLSRRFDSGAEVGVFATKTNVSAEEFGEGSFDKGAFISIPFDLLSFFSNRSFIGMGWRPLTRDGGQRLIQTKRLYPLVSDTGSEALLSDWANVLK